MKYDSGMTQFHKDIIAALRYMLGNDSEITEKFSPKDGSPAPLRDYLKQKYGKLRESHIGNGMRYSCNFSKGFELTFNPIINNSDYKYLTLSWSQTAKFIRDNWDEVFKKAESAAPQTETVLPKVGDYVGEDMLGDLLSFDELTEMIGQLAVNDYSTESKNWYKVVKIDKIHINDVDGSRNVAVIDGPKKNDIGRIGEYAFNAVGTHTLGGKEVPRAHRMWRLKQEPAKNQPSYIDKLREEYPKINETDDWFDEAYCPSELFVGKNVKDYFCEDCDYSDKGAEACQKCWRERCPENISFIENEDFEKEYFENYPEEESSEAASENSEEKAEADNSDENQIAVNTETALQGAFDYSELDGDTAKNLRDCETVIRQETAGYFTLLGAKFKEARELLANHANGTFEKWYTAMGFKRQTVYNLIQRYDFLGSPTIGGREDTFEALPLTLSYEVSKPDAPAELVEKVLDGDITTNAEYIKLKAKLEEANKRAETEKKAREAISQNLSNMEEGYREFKDKYTEEYYKNADLEKRVKELESRPVDVAVQDNDNAELMEELEELREENARLKDGVLHMVIRLTLDEYGNLVKLTQDDDALNYAVKHSHIFKS